MDFTGIINLFRQGKAGARSHIKDLIEIAACDGHFSEEEFQLLKKIARRNNITDRQLNEIRRAPDKVKLDPPQDERDRFHQLYDLVHMMVIDKKIHPEEVKLCDLFAVRFGYPSDSIKSMIEAIRLNIENGNDHNEAMKRVVLSR
jgi:uncharacterized tellurite resistance protein B-like protein